MTTVDEPVRAVGLRPPAHRVSRRAPRFWAARAALGWLVLLAFQVFVLIRAGVSTPQLVVLAATGVVAVAHVSVMPVWRYRVHRWETTDHAVYTRTGWITQEQRIAPMSRIQTVDTERGPLEQLFGLANVTVTTASASGPLKIKCLDRATAELLSDQLTARGGATSDDAT